MKTIGFVRAAQFHQKRRESLCVRAGDVVLLPAESAEEVLELCRDACDLTPWPIAEACGLSRAYPTVRRYQPYLWPMVLRPLGAEPVSGSFVLPSGVRATFS